MKPLFSKWIGLHFGLKTDDPFFWGKWSHIIANLFCFTNCPYYKLMLCTTLHVATGILKTLKKLVQPCIYNCTVSMIICLHHFRKLQAPVLVERLESCNHRNLSGIVIYIQNCSREVHLLSFCQKSLIGVFFIIPLHLLYLHSSSR